MDQEIQKVQTDIEITPENTLETIEAIGTSSRKIIIDRQTRDRIRDKSGITGTWSEPYRLYEAGTTTYVTGSLTLSDEVGDMFFQKIDNSIRIPTAGFYEIKITEVNSYSSTSAIVTTDYIMINDEERWSGTVTSNGQIWTIKLNLGKYDRLSIKMKVVSNSGSSRSVGMILDIIQL